MIQSRAGNSSFNRAICLLVRRDCLLISPQIILNNCRSLSCLEMKNGPLTINLKSIFTKHRNIPPYQAIWRHIRTVKCCGNWQISSLGLFLLYSSQISEMNASSAGINGLCDGRCITNILHKVRY